ncbi:alpha/beta fold hydrolase [Exilibacterium tricleocarpae]|nr:alpha/beta fold hydrolase [Exilibacterium tricleocarpae]
MHNNQTSALHHQPVSHRITCGDLELHYLACGAGEPLLLLHGWPTSSHLWRNVMPWLAPTHRVIALDLPGFGESSKPLGRTYSFKFYTAAIDAFLTELGIARTALVVHDLGGPAGLMWAAKNPQKVSRLALLNTLVYPKVSWAVKAFLLATVLPGVRHWLVSPAGLQWTLRLGVVNKAAITPVVMKPYCAPFASASARRALLQAARGMHPGGFTYIARQLPQIGVPVRLIYGAKDRILPDIAATMARLQADLPGAELTALPDCGHFLQEDAPAELGRLLADFFNPGT